MSLREDVELYTKLSGEDGSQETIGTIGAYLRGYRKGKEDAESEKRTDKRTETHACDSISRQAAIEVVQNRHMMLSKEKVLLINDLEKLPPAEPKRGKWIPITNGRLGHECDQCHEYAPSYESGNEYLSRFCHNCGADMRGEQDG